MTSTRDQAAAYSYAARRQSLALLRDGSGDGCDPRRRLDRALLGGLLVAVLTVGGAGAASALTGTHATSGHATSGHSSSGR